MQFFDAVCRNNLTKVEDLLRKGFDPNFHDEDTRESPLTQAAGSDYQDMTVLLVRFGAHFDFRAKSGFTAIHKAAVAGKLSPRTGRDRDRLKQRQTDTQTHTHTQRERHTQTNKQTHRHTDTQIHRHTDKKGIECAGLWVWKGAGGVCKCVRSAAC